MMLHHFLKEGDWFLPKRFGYGAGWPIAWQGWALLGGYLALAIGTGLLATGSPRTGLIVLPLVMLPATLVLVLVARKRTRGGWRWRSGERD